MLGIIRENTTHFFSSFIILIGANEEMNVKDSIYFYLFYCSIVFMTIYISPPGKLEMHLSL